jgi:hypothetical protein
VKLDSGLLTSGGAGRALWPAPSTPGATDDVDQHKERDDDADYDRDDGNSGGGEQHGAILFKPWPTRPGPSRSAPLVRERVSSRGDERNAQSEEDRGDTEPD